MNKLSENNRLNEEAQRISSQETGNNIPRCEDNLQLLIEELNIHQIELELQNTELQLANERLVEEQNKYLELYMNAPIAYLTINSTGNIYQMNYAAAAMLQIPIYSVAKNSIFLFLEEKSKVKFNLLFKKILNSQQVEKEELSFVSTTGQIIYTKLSASTYFDSELQRPMFRCTIDDITEQVLTHEKLKQEETKLNLILNNISEGIVIVDSGSGFLKYANRAFLELFGYHENDIKHIHFLQLYPSDFIKKAHKDFSNVGQLRKATPHVPCLKSDHSIFYADVFDGKIMYQGFVCNLSSFSNSTSRYEAEKELEKNKKQMDLFFKQSIDGFFFMMLDEPVEWNETVDKEKTLDYVFKHQKVTKINDAMLEQYKAKREEFIGFTPTNFFAHDLEHGRKLWRDFFDAGKLHIDSHEKKFDGTPMIINGDYICLYDDEQRITGHFGIQREVTNERLAEEKLRQSEERYKNFVNHSPDIIYKFSSKQGGIFWSDRVTAILGYTPEELASQPFLWTNSIHPEDKLKVFKAIEDFNKGYDFRIEYRIKTKAGNWIWLLDYFMHKQFIGDEIFIEGHATDITFQKQIQEELIKSEEKYRFLSENATDGVILFENNILKYISKGFLETLGYAKIDLENQRIEHIFKYFHPDDVLPYMKKMAKAFAQQAQSYKITYRLRNKQNEYLWFENSVKAEYSKSGEHLRSIIQSRNITDRIMAENALKKTETTTRAIIQTMPDLLFHLDKTGKFVTHYQDNTNLYKNKEYFVGKNVLDIFENSFAQKALKAINETLENKNVEIFYELQMDKLKHYHAKFSKLNEEEVICIARDISFQKEAELQLKQTAEELQKLIDDKNRFLQILAHDLRSPFSGMLGFLDLLIENFEKYDNAKVIKYINYINEIANQTYTLLEDLLLWSKTQLGRIPFEPKQIKISSICSDIINEKESQATLKEIKIKCNCSEIKVFADENMLKIILRNLISNAIKFSQKGGTITIEIQLINNETQISVSDEGIGINEENQSKMWNFAKPFTTAGTVNEKGTGLGLLICKEFVEKHSGKIWLESKEEKGTTFFFTLKNS